MRIILRQKRLSCGMALAICSAYASLVAAQDATTTAATSGRTSVEPSATSSDKPKTLAAITVRSEGHAEQLQKAPAPISVFNDAKIQDAGIQTTGDFVRLVPNMSYDTSYTIGNSFVTMRGIQQVNNADAPIAIVVDGVPQNNQKEFKMDLFDVEQIEVLRGPQGALYGRNAMGGAVVITTKQPTDTTEGFVQLGAGNGGLGTLSAAISGPISKDELFYRVSLSGSTFDGTLRNSYTSQLVDNYKNHDIRTQLKWFPTADQQVDLRVNHSVLWGGAIYDTSFPANTPNDTNTWQAPLSALPGNSKRDITSATLRYGWTLDYAVFSAITAYSKVFENNFGTLDFCNPQACPGGLLGFLGPGTQGQVLNVRNLSQEFRLSSREDAPWQWTAGVFYIHADRNLLTQAYAYPLPTTQVTIANSNEADHNWAWSAFGQLQIPVTDADRLGFSLRYDNDHRAQTDLATGNQRSLDFGAWQPKLTWSHDLAENQQAYATAAQGFRSGGFNGVGGSPFKDERLTNYEIGYKSSWLDNRLTFNSSLFYDVDHNYQFFYIDINAGGAQVIANLKRVQIAGLESEVNWMVRPGWELYGSLGLLKTRIDDTGELATDLPIENGNRLPRSEPYNFVVGSQWNFNLANRSAMFRLDASRKGPRTWEPNNVDVMNPVTLVNARMTWFGGEHWNISGWVTNLFNHRYYSDYVPNSFSGLGRDVASPAHGRLFGVDYRYDF